MLKAMTDFVSYIGRSLKSIFCCSPKESDPEYLRINHETERKPLYPPALQARMAASREKAEKNKSHKKEKKLTKKDYSINSDQGGLVDNAELLLARKQEDLEKKPWSWKFWKSHDKESGYKPIGKTVSMTLTFQSLKK